MPRASPRGATARRPSATSRPLCPRRDKNNSGDDATPGGRSKTRAARRVPAPTESIRRTRSVRRSRATAAPPVRRGLNDNAARAGFIPIRRRSKRLGTLLALTSDFIPQIKIRRCRYRAPDDKTLDRGADRAGTRPAEETGDATSRRGARSDARIKNALIQKSRRRAARASHLRDYKHPPDATGDPSPRATRRTIHRKSGSMLSGSTISLRRTGDTTFDAGEEGGGDPPWDDPFLAGARGWKSGSMLSGSTISRRVGAA